MQNQLQNTIRFASPRRGVLLLEKPLGISPLDTIHVFKDENLEYEDKKIGYAGRLDPMAMGVLLCLVDEENKKRAEYLKLDKTYEVSFVLGLQTDTFDVLGKVNSLDKATLEKAQNISKDDIDAVLQCFQGEIVQKYPPYSSKPINGRPLYYWAREGKLDTVDIPEEVRTIHRIAIDDIERFLGSELLKQIHEKLGLVRGNFRQEEILSLWEKELSGIFLKMDFIKVSIEVACSSGTYMRQLVQDIGEKLGCGACVFAIHRTTVGDFSINDIT